MNQPTIIIGIMSGTSLDGLDLACVEFSQNQQKIEWKWIATDCIPYTTHWKKRLKNAHLLSAQELLILDAEYGKFLGEKVNQFIQENQLKNVDLIASHGHTIFHQPEKSYTLQIGNGANIQATTGLKVICDFRSQDVALGGQGAPLVPVGDKLLFADYDACINLGGFANISFDDSNGNRIAFDICPVNYVLNFYAEKLNIPYDAEGKIAKKAKVHQDLLNQLNNLEFYQQNPPKSLGREWVENHVFNLLENSNHSLQDILATFTAHVAEQIAQVINQNNFQKVLCTGGGVFNSFLMECVQNQTSTKIIMADNQLINYKEALVFALLGYLKNTNQINVYKSVTGAKRNSSSGVVYE